MDEKELLMERWELASERIREIANNPDVAETFAEYFQKTASFLLFLLDVWENAEKNVWKDWTFAELKAWNQKLYSDIEGEAYQTSYANPAYACERLGEDYGAILAFVYAELRGMIVYAYEQRLEEMLIYMELF